MAASSVRDRGSVHGATVNLEPEFKVNPYLQPVWQAYREGVLISELADQVGVPVSTVRYYERIGLLGRPVRTNSGYRNYDDGSATRLLFVSRARTLGLSCEQIAELLPVWDGTDCTSARDRIMCLLDNKQAEIAARIEELTAFAIQLDGVRAALDASTPPPACRADLSCCVPANNAAVPMEFVPSSTATFDGPARSAK
jgi:DNA-binding transcriptional MerR regulator